MITGSNQDFCKIYELLNLNFKMLKIAEVNDNVNYNSALENIQRLSKIINSSTHSTGKTGLKTMVVGSKMNTNHDKKR